MISSTRAERDCGTELLPVDSEVYSLTSVCELPLADDGGLYARSLPLPLLGFSVRCFLLFFLGRSHSHRGINDSTCGIHARSVNPIQQDTNIKDTRQR